MPSKKDWAGLKFKLMKEQGECIDIIYIKAPLNGRDPQFFFKPHDKADGASALAELLQMEDQVDVGPLPTVKETQRPKLLKRLKLSVDHVKRQKPVDYHWKHFNPDLKGPADGISYLWFDENETRQIEEYAKTNKMNVNGLLLWVLDQVTSSHLLKDQQVRVWMVPVNMRTPELEYKRSGNYVTTLSVHIDKEGPQGIYQQIKDMMKSGIIWGGWIVANTPKYIGEKNLRRLSKNMKSPYIGLCSNLGAWPPPHCQLEKEDDHQWLIASPVTKFCPVAVVVLKWRGRLGLSLQLHPSLEKNLQQAEEMVVEILNVLKEKTKLDFGPKIHSVPWKTVEQNSRYF